MNENNENHPQTEGNTVSDNSNTTETLLSFPARFPVKIMGKNTSEFRNTVLDIVHQHIADKDMIGVAEKLSSNDKYLSLTVTAIFYDKAAIDALYMALTKAPDVMMAL